MSSSESYNSLFSKASHYSSVYSYSDSSSYSESSYSYHSIGPSKRLIRFCSAITGFIAFTTITLLIVILVSDSSDYSVIIIAPLVTGVIGAIIFGYFVKAGIILIGFWFGASIWYMIFYFAGLSSVGLLIGFSIAFGIAGAVLTCYITDKMVVIGTAFLGSQMFMQGVSYLSLAGYFVTIENSSYRNYSAIAFWAMFISSLVLWGIGMCFQFFKFRDYDYLGSSKTNKNTQSPV